jgi:hypothetical protein
MFNSESPPKPALEVVAPKEDRPVAVSRPKRPATPYDNLPDESFDRIARLLASALHAPIAIVSLLDADRHIVKSSIGLTGRSRVWRKVPLALTFAREAAKSGRTVVVSDITDSSAEQASSVESPDKSPDGVAYALHR